MGKPFIGGDCCGKGSLVAGANCQIAQCLTPFLVRQPGSRTWAGPWPRHTRPARPDSPAELICHMRPTHPTFVLRFRPSSSGGRPAVSEGDGFAPFCFWLTLMILDRLAVEGTRSVESRKHEKGTRSFASCLSQGLECRENAATTGQNSPEPPVSANHRESFADKSRSRRSPPTRCPPPS